jgi:ABC-type transport system involved in cytochrome c biogenesis permease component
MSLIVPAILIFPFAAGASFLFGGPTLGTVWIGVVLLTCLATYSTLFRTNTDGKDKVVVREM